MTRREKPFGRIPVVIKLGDFLQKKPVGSNISLVRDLSQLACREEEDLPVEVQQSMKLFVSTPNCF